MMSQGSSSQTVPARSSTSFGDTPAPRRSLQGATPAWLDGSKETTWRTSGSSDFASASARSVVVAQEPARRNDDRRPGPAKQIHRLACLEARIERHEATTCGLQRERGDNPLVTVLRPDSHAIATRDAACHQAAGDVEHLISQLRESQRGRTVDDGERMLGRVRTFSSNTAVVVTMSSVQVSGDFAPRPAQRSMMSPTSGTLWITFTDVKIDSAGRGHRRPQCRSIRDNDSY